MVSCDIDQDLHKEIKYAQDNLNSVEKQKRMGKKKKTWTFKETTKELAKYLRVKRLSKKQIENGF